LSTLEKFLDSTPDRFDIASLLDPEVELFEGAYSFPLIFKYCASTRRDFFARPQMRFSQREALNDPFEMSRRWKRASTEGLRQYIRTRIGDTLPRVLSNIDLLVEKAKEHFKEQDVVLSDTQVRQLEHALTSEAGKLFLASEIGTAQVITNFLLNHAFAHVESEFNRLVDNIVSEWGILSLTEAPLNQLMWAHYASAGAGFVVGLDANHQFFRGKDTQKNPLRKVLYTDERTENFWRNPYYLFLVKGATWAYEREWRIIKDLSECDERRNVSGQAICLWTLPPETIKRVYFGYGYDASQIADDTLNVTRYGAKPEFYTIRVNRETGLLEPKLLPQ
jgi:DUF2971 family protein